MNKFNRMENGSGVLEINGKEQVTPCFFPTLMFNSDRIRKIDDICQNLLPYITRTRLVNYVDLRLNTNFRARRDVLTFVDSGGFRLKEERAIISSQGSRLIWRNEEIRIQDILKKQCQNGDIGNTLDFPISPHANNKNDCVQFNLNSARKSLDKKPDDLFLYGSIQAWDYESAIEYSKEIASYPFDGFAIGGLVQFSREPQKVIDIVAGVRKIIPDEKPVHAFGVASPTLIPILVKLGVDTFDSSSYIRLSLDRKYYLRLCGEKMTVSEEMDKMNAPCFCPICKDNIMSTFAQATIRSYALLSLHNLHEIEAFFRYCRILIAEGRLEILVKSTLKRYGDKFDLQKVRKYLEKD